MQRVITVSFFLLVLFGLPQSLLSHHDYSSKFLVGNSCNDAIPLTPGQTSLNNCCPTNAEMWYEITPAQDGVTISFSNNTIGSSLSVEIYDACGGTLLSTYSGNFSESYNNCNHNFFIRVNSSVADCGNFILEYDDESCGSEMHDACDSSIPVNSLSLLVQTCFSGCLQYSCFGGCASNNGVWYAVDFNTAASVLNIEVQASTDFDPVISVFRGDCFAGDIFCENTNMVQVVPSGLTYYIEISSNGIPSNFDVCFTLEDIPAACSEWFEPNITRPENPGLNQSGPFFPGERINFCFPFEFTIAQGAPPIGNGCQWIQGVIPSVGTGWDLNTTPLSSQDIHPDFNEWYDEVLYSPHIQTTNPVLSISPSVNNPNGIDLEYTPGNGSLMGGDLLPGGWYATTTTNGGPCDGSSDPNGSWGFNSGSGCNAVQNFDFCFNLTVKDFATEQECLDADLSVELFAMADGMTGCWQNSSCAQDQPAVYSLGSVDCNQITIPSVPCTDTIENILCSAWFQDSIAQLECPVGDCRVNVIGLRQTSADSIEFIYIDVTSNFATDFGFGFVFDCSGQQVGTSTTTIGGTQFDPPIFSSYWWSPFSSFILGEDPCPEADNDIDGFTTADDCDDNNPDIYPGATELCNNIDDDCDGSIDEGFTVIRYYFDADGDGYGAADSSVVSCLRPIGFVENFSDCDDFNPNVNPAGTEIVYNGVDDDCNPGTRDDDLDEDGFVRANDCDDNNAAINPSVQEICDGLDNNCNSQVDEGLPDITYYLDGDGDGYGNSTMSIVDCLQPTGYVINDTDCNDSNPNVNPRAPELCDGLDNNCNSQVDEAIVYSTYYQDVDGDGFGDSNNSIEDCKEVPGYVTNSEDCDDGNPDINPDADEICDGLDNNCNSDIDEGLMQNVYYEDWDEDGYGNLDITVEDCRQVLGYVLNNEDCNDSIPEINPTATEVPNNGIDEDCDGMDLLDAVHDFSNGQVSIFPNPVAHAMYIIVEGQLDYQVSIFNLDGKKLLGANNPKVLAVDDLPNGTYILILKESETNNFIVERIVILK